MRRLLPWLLHAVRDDSGLTAVEYAVMSGVVIAIAGAAAYLLGEGVHKSSGKVTWAGSSNSAGHTSHASAIGARLIVPPATTTAFGSIIQWSLLSIGVTVGCAGVVLGWHYLRDMARHGQTRRRVRQSLADAGGQSVMERMLPRSTGTPGPRYKRPDTGLIGRNSPDVHHWLRKREVNLTAEVVDVTGGLRPETSQPPVQPRAATVAG